MPVIVLLAETSVALYDVATAVRGSIFTNTGSAPPVSSTNSSPVRVKLRAAGWIKKLRL